MTSIIASSLFALWQPKNLPKFPESDSFWMPKVGSTVAPDTDWTYMFIYWVSVVSAAIIFGVMVFFVIKYRASKRSSTDKPIPSFTHSTPLEIGWSIPPFLISVAVFVWGFQGFIDLRTPPKDSLEIQVTGQKWAWSFTYPNGCTDDTLHVPLKRDVRLVISSVDVIHSVWLPTMRVKMDAVPGRYTDLWFNAIAAGDFPMECTEYCGTGHSDMLTHLIVHPSQIEYDLWVTDCMKPPDDPVKYGEQLYNKKGCKACHTVDGSALIGPTFKGLWAKGTEQTNAGPVKIDENYVRESLMEPQAKLVNGFPPSMPTFKGQLKDTEISAIIAYLKSLK